jgi:hypothetical protein
LVILTLPLSLCAMTPLTESDLSNVSNPLSLNTNSDYMMDINSDAKAWDDSDVISKFLLNLNRKRNVGLYLDVNNGKTLELQETSKQFSFFSSLSWSNNDIFNKVQLFLVDPITGKNYNTIASSEDTHITYSNPQAENIHTITYPTYTDSSNSPYRYMIKSGNIDMRDTYINQTRTNINSGSWLDIRTH